MATIINLGALGSRGFTIRGGVNSGFSGTSVAAGDLNGDGFDDLFIGAPSIDSGLAYVLFGKTTGFAPVDLGALTPAAGFRVIGDDFNDQAGYSVSSAGDVNGDGFEDFILGAKFNNDAGTRAGAAYVIFGKPEGLADIDVTTLSPIDGFVIQGEGPEFVTGYSVASAGDVNGDGLDDLLVGAPQIIVGAAYTRPPGTAYLIYGSTAGFGAIDGSGRSVFNLSAIPAGAGSELTGAANKDRFGVSVDSAGDFNGDGFDDIIVGSPRLDGPFGTTSGAAFIVFGSSAGIPSFQMTAPGPKSIVFGGATNDLAGQSVSGAGDVNGDGFDDVVVGAPSAGPGDSGEAYVIFGRTGNNQTFNTATLSPADGFVIQGDMPNDGAGFSVSAAGDFNGDGFGDVVIGAPSGDDAGSQAGEAYVVLGQAGGFGVPDAVGRRVVDLSSRGDNVIVLVGATPGSFTGLAVAAGDINGDGFDDLLVGAPSNDAGDPPDPYGGSNKGESYVVFGSGAGDFPLNFDLPDDIALTSGIKILGDADDDNAGFAISSAGDVNGDGYGDFIVGAALGDDNGEDSGEAYLIFGRGGGISTVDLGALTAGQGIVIRGDADGADHAGFSVGAAGDFNDDGFADIIVGAPFGEDGGDAAGEAYVIFGKASGLADVDVGTLPSTAGFVIQGDTAGDVLGWSLSGAGDVNNDGFADVIVGAPGGDDGGDGAGEAYVVFGKASGFGTIDLSGLTNLQGFIVRGAADEGLGLRVSGAGDVNGDGFDDIIAAAPSGDLGGPDAGQAYVIFGKRGGFTNIDVAALTSAQGFAIVGDNPDDAAGWSVSSAGDFNGDGYDDVVVGAYFNDSGGGASGAAYVVFGHAGGFSNIDLGALTPSTGLVIQGDKAGDNAGYSVAGAGDVNGDGFDDVIVGAPSAGGQSDGRAYVIFGRASGIGPIDLTGLTATQGFILRGDDGGDRAGSDVSSAGDVNGDGLADLIVGAPGNDQGGAEAGAAYVVYGRLPTRPVTRIGAGGDQTLYGGRFADTLDGAGGSDLMIGGQGNDTYFVNVAGDQVVELFNQGRDKVYANVGLSLAANVEDLTLQPVAGAAAGIGNDLANLISGNDFGNTLSGLDGNDTLLGNGGNDILLGGLGADQLLGGASNDAMDGGLGADVATGGLGDDIYFVDNSGDTTVEAAGQGRDKIYATLSWTLAANVEDLTLQPAAGAADATGNALANVITGNDSANLLFGLDGADVLSGNGGADQMDGGAGADTMAGGDGNDIYFVDNSGDKVIESSGPNGGTDTVQSSVSFTLAANVERLVLTGTAAGGTGNALANDITGNAGANSLDGAGGADVLRGLDGNDVYFVDSAGDTVVEASGQGRDKIFASTSITLVANVEDLTLQPGAGGASGTGNDLANVLTGNAFNNVLSGLDGDDALIGNAGIDSLKGGFGRDTLQGGADADTFWFTTALNSTNVDKILDFQAGVDDIILENSVFGALPTGALAAGAFRTGSAAADADDRIIYNSATGALLYDADGNATGAAVQFATLQAGLALGAGDFIVI